MTNILRFSLIIPLILMFVGLVTSSAAPSKKTRRSSKPVQDVTLSEKAALEIEKIHNKKSTTPKTWGQSGIFTVQDPQLKVTERNWQYILGVKVQSFQPSGRVHSDIVGDFNLNNYHSQVLPTFELGIGKSFAELTPWTHWSGVVQFGYNTTKVPLVFQSGYRAPENTRLNTMKASVGIEGQRSMETSKPAFYKAGFTVGKFFYTQTSFNDLAQFSESLLFGSLNLGANYSWFENLVVSGDYVFRRPLQSSSLELQMHNFELGLRVLW